jgi:hypothetical protein
MIKTIITKRTKTVLLANSQVFDTYRRYEITIKCFGIMIFHRFFTHHMDYEQGILEKSKSIGFTKTNQNEKNEGQKE